MAKGRLKPSFLRVQGAQGLFLSQIMNFDWCSMWWGDTWCHITILHEQKLLWAVTTGCGHQAGTEPSSARGQSLGAAAVTARSLLPSRGPPGLPGAVLAPSRTGLGSHPHRMIFCWTAGLNRRSESHVNLKNIKMITSSRVTFLFIYRISQLCMTNFAQSHYLEQFV